MITALGGLITIGSHKIRTMPVSQITEPSHTRTRDQLTREEYLI